jgi:beta-barrel assembly-enhancing protease
VKLLLAVAAYTVMACAAAFAQDSPQSAELASPAAPAFSESTSFPAPARTRPALNTDEGGLWGASDRAEIDARASGQLEDDTEINAYVRGVACRVAGPYCGDIRLYLMNRPMFNAMMAPNGYMEVWSGLLLRAEDEAQLAFVLGHEVAHYSERHSLAMLRTIRGRANAAMLFSIVAGAAGVGWLGDIVYLGTLASVFSFSRENETDSDLIGFDHAVREGYDPSAGATLWRNLIAETHASDNPDVRRQETRASVFRTHPLSQDRVLALEQRARSIGQTHRERYRAAIRPHLNEWLRADLRRRDFGQTLLILDRLAAHGEDLGVIEYFRGEANRLRRADGDRERAITHYANATLHPDAPAAAWRQLGEYAERDGRLTEAAEFLAAYLEREPDAPDRALVQTRLDAIRGEVQ